MRQGESFEVLHHGRPAAMIVPPGPRPVAVWDDHLATAVTAEGRTSEDTVRADREGRW